MRFLFLFAVSLAAATAQTPSAFEDIARQMGGLRGIPIGGSSPQYHYPSEGTTIRLKDGAVLHAFNRRERPKEKDGTWHAHYVATVIAATYSRDLGKTWTAPQPLLESGARTASHPSLVRLPNGELGLSYNRIHDEKRAEKVFRYSKDEGKTWSPELVITPLDGYWTSAHDRLIVHSSGRLIHPFHNKISFNPNRVLTRVGWSDDNGRTWKIGPDKLHTPDLEPVHAKHHYNQESGFWEVSIAERADGSLLMLGRTGMGWVYGSESKDRGESWTAPVQKALAAPKAPVRLERVPGSNDLLVLWNSCCIDPTEAHLGNRLTLSSAISTDGGRTWKWQRDIESIVPTPGAKFTDVSYPSIYFDGGLAYVTYFARRLPAELQGEQYVSVLPLSWFYAARDNGKR